MTEKYLPTFVAEIRSYCQMVTEFIGILHTPLTAENLGSAATGLARLFHTIAGLSSSLEIADFAGLAESLESCLLSISADPAAAERANVSGPLADLLDFTNAYLSHRLQRIEISGQFQPHAPEDEEPLRLLEERLWDLGTLLEPPEEDAAPPAETLSEDDLAILRAFNASDLSAAEDARPDASQPGASTPADSLADDTLPGDETIPPELIELFHAETKDDLTLLQSALARLEIADERAAAVQEMRHIAHKIKGAASTLNLQVTAGLAHCLEDILDLLKSQRLEYAPAVPAALMRGVLEIEAALNRPATAEETSEGLDRLRAEYESLLAISEPEHQDDPGATQPNAPRLSEALQQYTALADVSPEQSHLAPEPQRDPAGGVIGRELSLRVEVSRLDQLMRMAGELASNRASTEQVRQEINDALAEVRRAVQKMTQFVNQLDEEPVPVPAPAFALSQGQMDATRLVTRSAITTTSGTDLELEDLNSEHKHLRRALREGVNDIATVSDNLHTLLLQMNGLAEAQDKLTSDIQHDITHLRLVPIGQIFPRLQLTARRIAQEQNKQINFLPIGAATEIDRDIIEAITGPLVQLVSNCVVHGIEPVEERRARGKPDVGAITLHAYYTGNEISIEVSDDGRGIAPHRLIEAAIAQGKLSPEEAQHLDMEQALNLILLPDISTSPEVTTVAGRGVGMHMVQTVVENLKGTLHIHSTPGEGTTFHLRLPISLGILHALFVRVGQQVYAVPMSSVARIWQPDDQQDLGDTVFFSLSKVLGLAPAQAAEEPAGQASLKAALIIPLRQRQIGVYVDEVLTDREVVIKRLPPHLRRRGVRGAILNPTGELMLLLDLPELTYLALREALAERSPRVSTTPAPAAPTTSGPKVLVVDDSLFMRRTLELQLTRAGYQVTSAKDGVEAMRMMTQDRPQVVLLDIEMPQLDGYGLLSLMRGQPRFNTTQVAILTSRAADKFRQHAMNLGANAYLVKPCPHDVLLQTVAELASQTSSIGK
jgi:chemosensory pili system protein ChpA (sensor histidine kinase/response regulator)